MTTANAIATPFKATQISAETTAYSQKRLWIGRFLTGLSGAFLIFDGGMKLSCCSASAHPGMGGLRQESGFRSIRDTRWCAAFSSTRKTCWLKA